MFYLFADYINRTVADKLKQKVRILCLILTMDSDLDSKAKTVEGTWAKRCNSYHFVANTKRNGPHIIHSSVEEKRNNLMQKVTDAFKHIHENLMTEFDWIFKCDDDTYAIIENMRFLLSHYNSSKPGYLGNNLENMFMKYIPHYITFYMITWGAYGYFCLNFAPKHGVLVLVIR